MKSVPTVADVMEALKERGFVFVGKSNDGWFKLHGRLTPPQTKGGFRCELQIDPTFCELPRIQMLELPPRLPAAVPHLGADGKLCYLAKGTVVLDIYDPIGQSLACLQRAAEVFGQVIQGGMIEDLAEEFFAYWPGRHCFVDMQGKDVGLQKCLVAQANGRTSWFITDDEVRTTVKMKSLGYQVTDSVMTYRLKTGALPRPMTNHWPPMTVGDILAWQSTLDIRCRREIHKRIKEAEKKKANEALILIESPLMTYGFAVFFEHKNARQKIKLLGLKDFSYGLKVMPISALRIDDQYLAQRNIPNSKTLAGKRLALVGCGTIGGYLSDMLVKAGAGACGGKLTLVDFETLLPQNIGRHRLGLPDLLSNKAEAMAKELRRLAPSTEIRALPVDVRKAELGELDLLIDATGEESLGHWLCRRYSPPTTPMLSIWIEGPGTAVRALLKTKSSGMCYRCLWHSNRRGNLRSTLDPLPNVLAGHGCEGLYVPFSASVSVHAASLGAEMALDWVNGVYSPSLRTRLIDRTMQLATPDCDPLPDPECPLCSL